MMLALGWLGRGCSEVGTLAVLVASWFSWELDGSTASLLGTGVALAGRLGPRIELARVVSLRHWGEVSRLLADAALVVVDGEGVAALGLPAGAALEKKPRMLRCCLPVDAVDDAGPFLAVEGVFAGVFAGVRAAGPDFSPIADCGVSRWPGTKLRIKPERWYKNNGHEWTGKTGKCRLVMMDALCWEQV